MDLCKAAPCNHWQTSESSSSGKSAVLTKPVPAKPLSFNYLLTWGGRYLRHVYAICRLSDRPAPHPFLQGRRPPESNDPSNRALVLLLDSSNRAGCWGECHVPVVGLPVRNLPIVMLHLSAHIQANLSCASPTTWHIARHCHLHPYCYLMVRVLG